MTTTQTQPDINAIRAAAGAKPLPTTTTPKPSTAAATASSTNLAQALNPTGTALQLKQGAGYGPSGVGTLDQAKLVASGTQVWTAPGATAPAPGVTTAQAQAAMYAATGLSPSTVTPTYNPSTGTFGQTTLGASLNPTPPASTATPQTAPATSTGPGVPTPVQAGQPNTLVGGSSAAPYVTSPDMSGIYGGGSSGGAGYATGTGSSGGTDGGMSTSTILLVGGGIAALLYLRKHKRKLA